MTMPDAVAVSPRQELMPAAALFHSLSDPTRLAIVQHLARGEARVVDLTERLGSAQSTVSAHLACLRDCGLVMGRPEGRQMFYSLTRRSCWTCSPPRRGCWGDRVGRGAVPELRYRHRGGAR
nr:metalloregulator ArsR/SmtB family transcription factor [Pseudonocardia alni]